MKVAAILSQLRRTYIDGKTLADAIAGGVLLMSDDYTPCTSTASPCNHASTCFVETNPPNHRKPRYIAVATQVRSRKISFGTKGCRA